MTGVESRIKELEELIRKGQLSEVENVWMEAIEDSLEDHTPFLALASQIAKEEEQASQASVLLELLVDPLLNASKPEAACEVVNIAARLDSNNRGLKESANKAYGARFINIEGFEDVLKQTEEKLGNNPGGYVESLEKLCSYCVGDYLFHETGWGLGKVVDLNLLNNRIIIDFEDTKGHEVELQAVTRFFRKLPADHILARKADDLVSVQAQAEENPTGLFLCVLKSLEGKPTLREVKEILVPDVINKSNWSKWWTALKKDFAQNGKVRIGKGTNPSLEVLYVPTTQENEYADTLQSCHTSIDFTLVLRKYLRDSKTQEGRADFLTQQMQLFFDRISRKERQNEAEKILGKLLLDEVKTLESDVQLDYPLDLRAICTEDKKLLSFIEDISIAEYQHTLFKLVQEENKLWKDIYAEALLLELPGSWEMLIRSLEEAGENEKVKTQVRKIYENGSHYPTQMLWIVRQVLIEDNPLKFELEANSPMIIGELFKLGMDIAHRLEKKKNDKKAKDLLIKFRAILSERNNKLCTMVLEEADLDQARHLLYSVRINGAISQIHQESLCEIILKQFPDLSAEETSAALALRDDDDEDTGEILATSEGYQKAQNELGEIMNIELPEVQKAIGEALALGDISENAELDAARAKEEVLRNQAARLSKDLKRSRIVNASEINSSKVGFGTKVELKNHESGEHEIYTILGRWDSNHEKHIISDISPIAKGIKGLQVGESNAFQTPDGAMAHYEVLKIEIAQ